MAHYYDSDDSTLYSRGSEQHRSRRRRSYSAERTRRPRRPRRRHSTTEEQKGGSGTAGTFVKLGLGVVLVQIVATCFTHWIKDKHETNEKEYREEKRRAFEKAKAKRRREEEEYEKRRQREEDDVDGHGRERGREWDEREVIIREGRRLMPADAEDAVSEDTEVRRIEPAPIDYHDDGYSDEDDDWDDARRRAPSVAARSRSRFGRTKSVTGLRDGRSRSRPAERVT